MKRKNMNPREYSFSHTRDRLRERYGMELDETGYDRLTNQVRESIVALTMNSPRARLINTENEQMTFIVEFQGREVAAVWDCRRALVTTVLPESVVAANLPVTGQN